MIAGFGFLEVKTFNNRVTHMNKLLMCSQGAVELSAAEAGVPCDAETAEMTVPSSLSLLNIQSIKPVTVCTNGLKNTYLQLVQ